MDDHRRTRLAFRSMSVAFAVVAVYFAVTFVLAFLHVKGRPIHTLAFSYALFSAITAGGLWAERAWARSVALVIAFATSALGAFQAFVALTSHRGPLVGYVVLFVVSTALTYVLTRSVFYPSEL